MIIKHLYSTVLNFWNSRQGIIYQEGLLRQLLRVLIKITTVGPTNEEQGISPLNIVYTGTVRYVLGTRKLCLRRLII